MNAGQKKLVVIVSVTAALSALAVFLYLFMGRETKEERVSSQQKDNIVRETAVPTPTAAPHKGMVRSRITGKWIKEDVAK